MRKSVAGCHTCRTLQQLHLSCRHRQQQIERSRHALALAAGGGHVVRLLGQQEVERQLLRGEERAADSPCQGGMQFLPCLHVVLPDGVPSDSSAADNSRRN